MLSKKISKEETDIRMVGCDLERMLSLFSRIHGRGTPVTDETKKKVADTIKDICDTIVQYVELF